MNDKATSRINEEDPPEQLSILNTSIDELYFTPRVYNTLEKCGVKTLRDLSSIPEADLLKCRNFGKSSLQEVKRALAHYGLTLRAHQGHAGEDILSILKTWRICPHCSGHGFLRQEETEDDPNGRRGSI